MTRREMETSRWAFSVLHQLTMLDLDVPAADPWITDATWSGNVQDCRTNNPMDAKPGFRSSAW
jgi:hypothetical protein